MGLSRKIARQQVEIKIDEQPQAVRNGDLLQFRGNWWSPVSLAIQVAGRSAYSHSAMAGWLPERETRDSDDAVPRILFAIEVREFIGGRKRPLADYVSEHPGKIDVFRPAPRCVVYDRKRNDFVDREFDGLKAVDEMLKVCHGYGYLSVLRTGLLHIPLLRLFTAPSFDDTAEIKHYPPYCSQAYAVALRRAYVDPVPMLEDHRTEPGDLTRSHLLANYIGTLVP